MKIYSLRNLLPLLLLLLFFVSCNDDDDKNGSQSALTNVYSNKATASTSYGSLEISYSGGTIYGKDVYLEMTDANSGNLKLNYIFPAESESVIENISLVPFGNGYSFSGSTTSSKNTTFDYAGSITDGKMKLDLTNIKIPANPLSNKGTFKMMEVTSTPGEFFYNEFPFLFDWKVKTADGTIQNLFNIGGADFTAFPMMILSNLIYLTLHDITFLEDGNITANYSPLSEDFNLGSILMNPVDPALRLTNPTTSPINLCQYYVEGPNVYIRPDIEMIVRLIMSNRAETKADDGLDLNEIINMVMELYPFLNRWVTEGIKFNLKENNPNELVEYVTGVSAYFRGDYQLYIDEEEFTPVISLIPFLMGMLNLDFSSNPILSIFESSLESIIANTQQTTSLKLGFYLSLVD